MDLLKKLKTKGTYKIMNSLNMYSTCEICYRDAINHPDILKHITL